MILSLFIIPTSMDQLGNLEETILLLMLSMKEKAYGFSVSEEYKHHVGKSISISAVHTVLSRLEKKGYLDSQMGGATDSRGGRRKRIFVVNQTGKEVIREMKGSREKLWNLIPGLE